MLATSQPRSGSLLVAVVSAGLALCACNRSSPLAEEQGQAPPPAATANPGVCKGGGGKVTDARSAPYFVRRVGHYCVDPNGETRVYGKEAPQPLDDGCTQFDGECPIYKHHGLERLVMLRYVDGRGAPSSVDVQLSRFETARGAFAFFTKRVLGDGDPARASVAPLDAGGAAALGSGNAYLWRGRYVAELLYHSEVESPDQQRLSSKRVLPPLARALGDKLPGETAKPSAAALLPDERRLPLGVSYSIDDVLDVKGAGEGAVGFYRHGSRRWRVFVIERGDEEEAKDVVEAFRKLRQAEDLEGVPLEAYFFGAPKTPGGPRVEWVLARVGKLVVGVGDEPLVLSAKLSEHDLEERRLERDEKVSKLKVLLAAAAARDGAEDGN